MSIFAPQLEDREYALTELAQLNRESNLYELVRGKPEPLHWWARQARILPRLCAEVVAYLNDNPVGEIYPRLSFVFQRTPPTVRTPALSFISLERLPDEGKEQLVAGFWEFVPDLAVDIVAANDEIGKIYGKAEEYLSFGIKEVWLIVPPVEAVIIYRSKKDVKYLVATDNIESSEILPGFSVPVAELFENRLQKKS